MPERWFLLQRDLALVIFRLLKGSPAFFLPVLFPERVLQAEILDEEIPPLRAKRFP